MTKCYQNLRFDYGSTNITIIKITMITIKFMRPTYHRNDVDFVAQSSHELEVELFELVTVGRDEVEASVHPGNDDNGDDDDDNDDNDDNENE